MDKLIAGVIPLPGLQVVIHDIQPDEPEDMSISTANALESELTTLRRQYADLTDDYARLVEALEAIADEGVTRRFVYAQMHDLGRDLSYHVIAEDALNAVRKGGR